MAPRPLPSAHKERRPVPYSKPTKPPSSSRTHDVEEEEKAVTKKTKLRLIDVAETDVPGLDKLNIKVLRKILESWAGVDCVEIIKLEQGRYHVVYRAQFDDWVKKPDEVDAVYIRLDIPYMENEKLESEVATMHYIRACIPRIPVPEVYLTDSAIHNPLGCEYLLMAPARGVSMQTMWSTWDRPVKQRCILELADICHVLFLHSFGKDFGALYNGKVRAGRGGNEYTVGALVLPEYFDRSFEPSAAGPSASASTTTPSKAKRILPARGPWKDISEWMCANAKKQLEHLKQHGSKAAAMAGIDLAAEQPHLIDTRKALLRKMVRLAGEKPYPPRLPLSQKSCLARPDIEMRDIMALPDDGHITAVLDWEMTATVPLWQAAVLPTFLENAWESKDTELLLWRRVFKARMKANDAITLLTNPHGVPWYAAHAQGQLFRDLKEHCDRQWYELDDRTYNLVQQWEDL